MKTRKATLKDTASLAELLWEMSTETYKEFKDPLYKPLPKKQFLKAY